MQFGSDIDFLSASRVKNILPAVSLTDAVNLSQLAWSSISGKPSVVNQIWYGAGLQSSGLQYNPSTTVLNTGSLLVEFGKALGAYSATDGFNYVGVNATVFVPNYGMTWHGADFNTPSMYMSGYSGINMFVATVNRLSVKNTGVEINGFGYSSGGFFTSSTNVGIAGDGSSLYLKSAGNTYLNTNNNAYVTNSGAIITTSSITAASFANNGAANGYIGVQRGGTTNSGYVEFYTAANARLGYIGFSAANMNYVAENGAKHWFSGGNLVVNYKIENLVAGTAPTDAVNKSQLDSIVAASVSGTGGYVARFTSATTIGNSTLQDDGSYAAFGRAPLSGITLAVNSSGFNTTVLTLSGGTNNFSLRTKFYDPTNQNVKTYRIGLDYLAGTGENGYVDFYRGGGGTDGYLKFGTSGVDRMTLDAAGNLLVGSTSNIAGKVQVNGDVSILSNNKIRFYRTDNAAYHTLGYENADDLKLYNGNGGSIIFGSNLTSDFGRWNPSGRLLIGTSTDDSINKLQVNGGLYATSLDINGVSRTRNYMETIGNGAGTIFALNAYYSSGWKARTTGYSALIDQDPSGNIRFFQANTVAANASISTTNILQINNSGGIAVTGASTFTSSVTAGIFTAPEFKTSSTATQGFVGLSQGNTTYSGYVNFYSPDQNRIAYIGFNITGSALAFTSSNGQGFVFNGGNVNLNTNKIISLGAATNASDAVRLDQLQNSSNQITGTLADARLSSNVALYNAVSPTFTGNLAANNVNSVLNTTVGQDLVLNRTGGSTPAIQFNTGVRLYEISSGKTVQLGVDGSNILTINTGLRLTNGTMPFVIFDGTGVAAPSNTTRSVGTKVVLYPSISGTTVDYAFGIESGVLWSSVPATTSSFRWYGGTSLAASLTGAGVLTTTGTITGANLVSNGSVSATGNVQGLYLTSTASNGTAPLTVGSQTLVSNLNSNFLQGYTANQLGFYIADGTLNSARIVSQGANNLTFAQIGGASLNIDGLTSGVSQMAFKLASNASYTTSLQNDASNFYIVRNSVAGFAMNSLGNVGIGGNPSSTAGTVLRVIGNMSCAYAVTLGSVDIVSRPVSITNTDVATFNSATGLVETTDARHLPIGAYSSLAVSTALTDVGSGVMRHALSVDCQNFHLKSFSISLFGAQVDDVNIRITMPANAKLGGIYILNFYNGASTFSVEYPSNVKKQDSSTAAGTYVCSNMFTHMFTFDGTYFIKIN